MKVDIYPSQKTTITAGIYIAVPSGQAIPQQCHDEFGPFGPIFKTVDVKGGDKRIAMDAAQTLAEIAERGFAVLGVSISAG